MTIDRRAVVRLAAASVLALAGGGRAFADDGLFPLRSDDGRPVGNFRISSDIPIDGLPGLLTVGAREADVVLFEFFDYNCPYCRAAVGSIDVLIGENPRLRLTLVDNPILSRGSKAAAQVQQAVLRLNGPGQAYAFHKAALSSHGVMDGPAALAVAAVLGLDREAVAESADLAGFRDAVVQQAQTAQEFGFETTPSFVLGSYAVAGYPGPNSLRAGIAATRKYDRLVCGVSGVKR